MNVSFSRSQLLVALTLVVAGCPSKAGEVGSLLGDDASGSGSESETAEGGSGGSTSDMTTSTGDPTDGDAPPSCIDPDSDGIASEGDNDPVHTNSRQSDIDGDGVVDEIDMCPTVASPQNSADADGDGVGNECDLCERPVGEYNEGAQEAFVPAYMQVRNIPSQADADGDGIGDACDNCVVLANCEGAACQTDDDADLVGDACVGMMGPDAAGPVGFGDGDDFDQDGVTNELDACPRQPIAEAERVACEGPSDCDDGRRCDDGWCDHVDTDDDGIGDICDTCAFTANPNQVIEGGAQEDDSDGDFVGSSCETSPACMQYEDARPYGFHAVQAAGNCCTVALAPSPDADDAIAVGDLLIVSTCDPDSAPSALACLPLRAPNPDEPTATLPVRRAEDCAEEQVDGAWVCRKLPAHVAGMPGVLSMPPGCDAALGEAGIQIFDNDPLDADDFGGDLDALLEAQCFLPQLDTDFDGLGDICDFCPLAFDPENLPYVDDNGMLWPNDGQMCNGDFAC